MHLLQEKKSPSQTIEVSIVELQSDFPKKSISDSIRTRNLRKAGTSCESLELELEFRAFAATAMVDKRPLAFALSCMLGSKYFRRCINIKGAAVPETATATTK